MRSPTLHELPPPPEAMTVWPWTRGSDPLPSTMPDGQPWPVISIVTPSFNQAVFLDQAIRSVLLQGYPRLELIVMDGGSTDGTVALLEKYGPWLKHWVSAPDRGPADALNMGLAQASGDLLAVLNADDFYLAGALATVAGAFAAEPAADVISGHGYFTRRTGELGVPLHSDRFTPARFRNGACVLVQPATFFRREAFERAGGFRLSGRLCWDMELWADMATTGAQFRPIDAYLSAFRLHEGSITGRADLGHRRRQHARAVMEELRGRPESSWDRLLHFAHRVLKFSDHPARTLRQRAFVYSELRRWTL